MTSTEFTFKQLSKYLSLFIGTKAAFQMLLTMLVLYIGYTFVKPIIEKNIEQELIINSMLVISSVAISTLMTNFAAYLVSYSKDRYTNHLEQLKKEFEHNEQIKANNEKAREIKESNHELAKRTLPHMDGLLQNFIFNLLTNEPEKKVRHFEISTTFHTVTIHPILCANLIEKVCDIDSATAVYKLNDEYIDIFFNHFKTIFTRELENIKSQNSDFFETLFLAIKNSDTKLPFNRLTLEKLLLKKVVEIYENQTVIDVKLFKFKFNEDEISITPHKMLMSVIHNTDSIFDEEMTFTFEILKSPQLTED